MELFDRRVEVEFGKSSAEGVRFKDLRITFKIEKTGLSLPNKGEVKIYNLSAASRALAEQKGTVLIVRAGYGFKANGEANVETIFSGDVARTYTERDGPNYVTTFELGDGEVAYQSAKVDKTYSAGTSLGDVFSSIAASFGLNIGDQSGIKNESLISPLSISGPARRQLDDLAERQDAEWSIQDQAIQFIPKGGFVKEDAILLTRKTGLVGVPVKLKEDEGLQVRSLLQGRIAPGKRVAVESAYFTGTLVVNKVTHEGDTHGSTFTTLAEGKPL